MAKDPIDFAAVTDYLTSLQNNICTSLNSVDDTNFFEESWQRPEGGGGRSRVLREGKIFEQAGG